MKKKNRSKIKKILLSGLIAGIASFIVGNILYMNPLVSGIYDQYAFECSKSMDLFGGVLPWVLLMGLMGIISTFFIAWLYSYTEKGLSVKSPWKKGLFFGFLLFLIAKVPTSYYTWLMYDYPDILNLIETFNGLITGLIGGIVLAIAYEKIK